MKLSAYPQTLWILKAQCVLLHLYLQEDTKMQKEEKSPKKKWASQSSENTKAFDMQAYHGKALGQAQALCVRIFHPEWDKNWSGCWANTRNSELQQRERKVCECKLLHKK